MRPVVLHGLAEEALGQLGLPFEDDLADADLGALIDLEQEIDLVLALLGDFGVDLGGLQALLREEVADRPLDFLDLGGAVIGVRQDVLVLLLELVDDIVFLDLLPGLVDHALDDRILLNDDLDDLSLGPFRLLDPDVGEKPRGPEDPEIPLEEVLVEIVPFPCRKVILDGLLGHPVIPQDLDLFDHFLGGEDQGGKKANSRAGINLLHDHILIPYSPARLFRSRRRGGDETPAWVIRADTTKQAAGPSRRF